jgi:hypothetical protein
VYMAVKRAATPKVVKKATRAMHPAKCRNR